MKKKINSNIINNELKLYLTYNKAKNQNKSVVKNFIFLFKKID